MAKGQRNCIFCGGVANSHEHLLPEWLQTILPSDERVVHTRDIDGVQASPWEKKPFTERTKVVCRKCNHGWLSRLESETKPLLTPVITRRGPCQFDLGSQWIVARWAVKTCYVFQGLMPKPLAPMTHPLLLHMNSMPPQQVTVWMGSHYRAKQDPINSISIIKPVSLRFNNELEDLGYMSFLAVGGAAFLIVGHRLGSYVECVLGEQHPSSQMFTKIWPHSQQVVDWPPYLMADRDLIEMIFDPDTLPLGIEARLFPGRLHEEPYRYAHY
jgi:hypothetical protein